MRNHNLSAPFADSTPGSVSAAGRYGKITIPNLETFSVTEMELEHERDAMPAPSMAMSRKPARVSGTCLVSVASSRYSVPCRLAGQMISTRLYPSRVLIVAHDTLVASHERLSARGQTRYDPSSTTSRCCKKARRAAQRRPLADMPDPLQRLRRAILREEGGDRVMAQVLAIIPDAGLDAVLVAVELALESTAPSGRVSVEHVISVLAPAQTPHQLRPVSRPTCRSSTPPLADTARYDSLRTTDAHALASTAVVGGKEADHA